MEVWKLLVLTARFDFFVQYEVAASGTSGCMTLACFDHMGR